MKKFALRMAFGSAALLALAACSESDDANISTNIEELIAEKEMSSDIDYTLQAETYDSLPECFPKNDGDIVWVKNESKAYKCDRRTWTEMEISSSSENIDDDGGKKVEVEEEEPSLDNSEKNADDSVLVYPDESSSSAEIVIIVPPSSDSEEPSSSEESSSSEDSSDSEDSSSSEELEVSSSSYSLDLVPSDADMWSGWASYYRVDTGIDAGAENAGLWFEYNDAADGGNSTINWPVARGNEYDAGAFDPIIDYCGGICGEYKLNEGFDYPFVGIGFNIVGSKTSTTAPEPADVSAWEGICIVYALDRTGVLEMGFTDSLEKEMKYDVPNKSLPKSTVGTVKDIKWGEFQQAGWGNGLKISGEVAAKELVSLKFKIQGSVPGESGHFNVMAVGRYKTCSINN